MATQSIHNQIVNIIEQLPRGSLIFPSQFLEIGSESAIRMSLSRLAKEDQVERLAHGIYIIPKVDSMLGKVYPPTEEIAKAIADRDKVTIRPTGAYALNRLGLSTQIPMNYVYITDGAARNITIGKSKIKFKATVPKKLATQGPISGLVIQALEELGPDEITVEMMSKITNLLKQEDPELLRHDAKLTSARIARIFYDILQQQIKDDTVAAAQQ